MFALKGFHDTKDLDTEEMARYIVSVIEGAIMLTRTHRDDNVIKRQVHHLREDIKRSFQTTDQRKGEMSPQ
jgi:DNA-directed RNA polymerase specialized sigma subunit